MSLPTEEPTDAGPLPLAHLGRPVEGDQPDPGPGRRVWPIVVAAAVIVVAGLVIGILLVNASAPPLGRGAETASVAATRYVRAVNSGNETSAAAIACDSFADEARAQARSGADTGISFRRGTLTMVSKTDATVDVVQLTRFAGGQVRQQHAMLYIARSRGRWLVCGRAA